MTKDKFLSTLRHVIRHQAKPQTAQCRCADCCNEKRKNQGKPVVAPLK